MADTYEIKDSGNEQVDGIYTVSENLWSLKEVTTLTIEGVVYTLRDDSKVALPLTEGSDGQVLAKKGEGTEWITVTLTETDPTVPAWAKEANKPSYTYSEISNTPDLTGFAVKGDLFSKDYNDLTNKPDLSVYATKQDIVTLYKPKGSVATEQLLPSSNNTVGDVYHVEDTGAEYVYTESGWEYLGEKIDLSAYAKKSDVPNVDGLASEKYVAEAMNQVDYTAWEVYPTSGDLEAGAYTQNDFTNIQAIPASNIEEFTVSIITAVEDSDVVIDWGDGNKSIIANNEYTNVGSANARGERDVTVQHEYTVSDTKYIVKVFGRGYCKIVHPKSNNNLMCRVFEADLPIASHFKNLWQFAYGAKRLLSVTVGQMHPIVFATNLGGLFQNCINLQKATGFERMYNLWGVGSMFNGCVNLKTTDFKFSPDIYQADNVFLNCLILERNVNDFFQGLNNNVLEFKNSYVDLAGAFANCQLLSGTISDAVKNILWNNSKTKINTGSSTFTNVGLHQDNSVNERYDLLNQIPVSWGGRNTNIVPAKLIEDQVSSLIAQVADIDTTLTEVQEILGIVESNIDQTLKEF